MVNSTITALTPPLQNAPTENWLFPEPTRRLIGSNVYPFALIDKTSRHYDPIFPRPTKGKWLESDLLQYMAVKHLATLPPNNPPNNPPIGRDRRVNKDRRLP